MIHFPAFSMDGIFDAGSLAGRGVFFVMFGLCYIPVPFGSDAVNVPAKMFAQ
jgi:hypothetical protein